MKFEFSFQKVLDFKEKEKEVAKIAYGTAKHKQIELEEQMNHLELKKEQVFHQFDYVNSKTVSEILELQQEIEHVNLQKKRLEDRSNLLIQEVEETHQVLIERSQEAKMWNQWKTKSIAAFKKQLEQQEQAMFDEMAVLRHTRKV